MTLILSGTDGLSDVDGSAATPAIRGTDANTGIFFPAADTIAFSEGGVESARIDSAGNFGLGVTPSATWSSAARAIQLGGFNSIFGYTSNVFRLANNAIFTASNETYGASSIGATYYQQYNGAHSWYNAASGTAGNTISFTQAMTLDASGNLGIGTSSPAVKLDVAGFSKGAIVHRSGSYTNGATTPSVSGATYLIILNSSPTTITNFTNAEDGQIIYLYFSDSNTTINRSNCYLAGGVNFVSTAADVLVLLKSGSYWFEVSRSVNS